MKILLATPHFSSSFKSLFDEDSVSIYNGEKNIEVDAVIFTGGEDVDPRRYLPRAEISLATKLCSWSVERDDIEMDVFNKIIEGQIKTNRVIGVCRGLQVINVMLGGGLYYDLPTFNKGHGGGLHNIQAVKNSVFSNIKKVNSLHHQGVKELGGSKASGSVFRRFFAKTLAIEPYTNVVEILEWTESVYDRETSNRLGNKLSDKPIKIIGFQFHPEFFPASVNNTTGMVSRTEIRDLIKTWISEE